MNTIFIPQVRRLLCLVVLLGLTLITTNTAQAGSLDLASIHDLTPLQELKSQVLERRFELVLSRHEIGLRKAPARCEAGVRSACKLAKWQQSLKEIASEPLSDQLYQINAYVNHVRYKTDQRNWQRPDVWAVPEEFFDRGGDCEDYAIAKYVALRTIGIPAEDLRIVVVYDRLTQADHAILTVSSPDGIKVLDSNRKRVIDWAEANQRYAPYYSINERAVWIHSSKV